MRVELTLGRAVPGAAGDTLGYWAHQPGGNSRRRGPLAIVPAAGLCLALLTACGGSPVLLPPATSTPGSAVLPATPTASPAVTPTPRPTGLGEIRWSSEELTAATPAAGITQLTIEAPRIVASVPGYSLPVGAQVSAAWFYNDTTLDAFATTLTVEQTQDEQWFAFQLTRNSETPWPPGVYEITISLDGQPGQSAAVEVVPLS